MKTASVRELRNNFAKISRWLENGEEVEITKRGEVTAKLVAVKKSGAKRKRKLFDAVAHRKWMKETYGDKVLPGNSVLIMREGSEW
jgi:prevent-host-death family protein